MRRFLSAPLPRPDHPVSLGADASHHLVHVLRAGPGRRILLFDGDGLEVEAEVVSIDDAGRATVAACGPPRRCAPPVPVHLGLARLKGPAMDLALRMATEAGATDLHPIQATRSVGRGEKRKRWERILTSAAQQCGRGDVPTLHPLVTLDEVLARWDRVPHRWIAVPGCEPTAPGSGESAVLVGPEGGWTPQEIALAEAAGVQRLGLGRWVLRASTAAPLAVAAITPSP